MDNERKKFIQDVVKAKINQKVLPNEQILLSVSNPSIKEGNSDYKYWLENDKERVLDSRNKSSFMYSYEFMKFIKDELNKYVFSNESVRKEKPLYRHPFVKDSLNGLSFDLVSDNRIKIIQAITNDGRLDNKKEVKQPLIRIVLNYNSKIKQLLNYKNETYSVINEKKLTSLEELDGKDEMQFDIYIPKLIFNSKKIKNKSYDELSEDELLLIDFYFKQENNKTPTQLIKDGYHLGKESDEILDFFHKEPLFDAMLLHDLYEELLININKRFKRLKINNDIRLDEEVKLLSGLFKRNSLLLDAFVELNYKNENFIEDMYVSMGIALNDGYVNGLKNYKSAFSTEHEQFLMTIKNKLEIYRNFANDYSSNKKNMYMDSIRGFVNNQKKNPFAISTLRNNPKILDFIIFLYDSNEKLYSPHDLQMGKEDPDYFTNYLLLNDKEPYVIDIKNIKDLNKIYKKPNINVLNNEIKDDDLEIITQLTTRLNLEKIFNKSTLLNTDFNKYKYMEAIVYVLNNSSLELHVDSLIDYYKSVNDITDVQEMMRDRNLDICDIKISYSQEKIDKMTLVKLVKQIALMLNEYIEDNIYYLSDKVEDITAGQHSYYLTNKNVAALNKLNNFALAFENENIWEGILKKVHEIKLNEALLKIKDSSEFESRQRKKL